MGMFTIGDKNYLKNLYGAGTLKVEFTDYDSVNESIYLHTAGKDAITIFIRSRKETNASHWCSVKAYKGGKDSKRIKEGTCSYLVNGIDHPIKNINDIELDKHCDNESKKFDRKYGKIVRMFIMTYQKEIIDYWNAEDLNSMETIKNEILSSLVQNNFNFV